MKKSNNTGYLNTVLLNFSLKTRNYETLSDYSHTHCFFFFFFVFVCLFVILFGFLTIARLKLKNKKKRHDFFFLERYYRIISKKRLPGRKSASIIY